jgi:hypothetical protein
MEKAPNPVILGVEVTLETQFTNFISDMQNVNMNAIIGIRTHDVAQTGSILLQ